MTHTKALRVANELLIGEYGHSPYSPDLGNLAWGFSDPDVYDHPSGPGAPMWWIGPLYSPDGEPVLDYRCSCGVNPSVHLAECSGLVTAQVRMGKHKCAPFHERMWLLGKWIPPPSAGTWVLLDGSMESYPRRGRFEAMSINGSLIHITETQYADLPRKTSKIIVILRDFAANKNALLEAADERDALREWRPPRHTSGALDGAFDYNYQPGGLPGSRHNQNYLLFRDKMSTFGQTPGKKQHVSYAPIKEDKSA